MLEVPLNNQIERWKTYWKKIEAPVAFYLYKNNKHSRWNHPRDNPPFWQVNKKVLRIEIEVHGSFLHDFKKWNASVSSAFKQMISMAETLSKEG